MTTPQVPMSIYEDYVPRRRRVPSVELEGVPSEDQEMARIILTSDSETESADNAFETAANHRPEETPFDDEQSDPSLYGMGTQQGNLPKYVATTLGYGKNPNVANSAELANKYYNGVDIAQGADYAVDAAEDAEDFSEIGVTRIRTNMEDAGEVIEEGALNADAEETFDDMMETARGDNFALATFEDGLAEEEEDLLAGSEKTPDLAFVKKLNQKSKRDKYKYKYVKGRRTPIREPNPSAGERLVEKLREAAKGKGDSVEETKENTAAVEEAAEIIEEKNREQQQAPTVSGDPVGSPPVIDPTSGLVVPGTGNQQRFELDDEDEGDDLRGFGGDDEPEREREEPQQQRGPVNLDDIPDEDTSRVKADLGLDPDDPSVPRSVKEVLGKRGGRRRRDRRKDKKGRGMFR